MQKNVASQKIGCQMISATDGSNFTGSVTVYVTGDAGTQAVGSVSSGACTHEGKGYHTYAPSQAETNYDLIAFTFEGTGAVTSTVQVETRHDANLTHSAGTAITSSGGRPEVNTTAIAGSTTAATNQKNAALAAYPSSVTGTSTTTTIVDTALTQVNDFWNGRIVIFLSGSLIYQATRITDFDAATDTLTVDALTAAPSVSDTYIIL